jgi:hypothetical protein
LALLACREQFLEGFARFDLSCGLVLDARVNVNRARRWVGLIAEFLATNSVVGTVMTADERHCCQRNHTQGHSKNQPLPPTSERHAHLSVFVRVGRGNSGRRLVMETTASKASSAATSTQRGETFFLQNRRFTG